MNTLPEELINDIFNILVIKNKIGWIFLSMTSKKMYNIAYNNILLLDKILFTELIKIFLKNTTNNNSYTEIRQNIYNLKIDEMFGIDKYSDEQSFCYYDCNCRCNGILKDRDNPIVEYNDGFYVLYDNEYIACLGCNLYGHKSDNNILTEKLLQFNFQLLIRKYQINKNIDSNDLVVYNLHELVQLYDLLTICIQQIDYDDYDTKLLRFSNVRNSANFLKAIKWIRYKWNMSELGIFCAWEPSRIIEKLYKENDVLPTFILSQIIDNAF